MMNQNALCPWAIQEKCSNNLVEISQESYVLWLDCFSYVFDQINQRIANSEVCCVFDHLGIFKTCTYICV